MRYKRAILNAFVCIAGYFCSKIFTWALLQLLPYQWANDGSVELDYIRPSIMDEVDDYSKIYDIERRVRILCWTFVVGKDKSDEMREKFEHIGVTWGQKCTTLLFISDGKPEVILGRRKSII